MIQFNPALLKVLLSVYIPQQLARYLCQQSRDLCANIVKCSLETLDIKIQCQHSQKQTDIT